MDDSENQSLRVLLNNRPIDEFEGYTPAEMHYMLYDLFSPDCPVRIRAGIGEDILKKMPMVSQVNYMLKCIKRNEKIKLTVKRNFPVWLVKDIYAQGIMKDEFIEKGYIRLNREGVSYSISVTNSVSRVAGLTKVRHNHILLTGKGKKLIDDWYGLFICIFKTFSLKYAWSHDDGYEDNDSCQRCLGFSLKLLSKYGEERRAARFYADRFLVAFPTTLDLIETPYGSNLEEAFFRCHSHRTFERFLASFNLITIDYEGTYLFDRKMFIRKTGIFDKVFEIE